MIYGKNKLIKLQHTYSEKKIKKAIVYADHYTDIDLLKNVKKPFLVNPSKKSIKAAKKYRKIKIFIT